MCGIAGIYLNKKTTKKEQKDLETAIKKMNDCQKFRGPDDEGINLITNNSTTIVFGHRRLSILDLSKAGHQPMSYSYSVNKLLSSKSNNPITNNSITITFNGEIYNFQELRRDLEKNGYKFKTKTDTEVILALYAKYGEKSFSMLRGMFAFGLYDAGRRKFFLVKDRYGIKPIYYYTDENKLIFTSTVKAIAESGLISAQKNPEAYIGFLLFGSVPLPITTIKNVFSVPAGHYLVREASGSQKLIQYYEPLDYFNMMGRSDVPNIGANYRTSDVRNIVLRIRALLEDSVELHLISDAPLGVFLSGGLDSSAIAALAAFNIGKSDSQDINGNVRRSGLQKVITLSIIFDEKEFSEEYYSDLVAQKIDSDHRKIKITKEDFFGSLDEIFEAMDQPTIDGVNTFFIAKAAKQAELKTVLSGLGADEIFLGYSHFRRAKLLRKIQKIISIFGHRKSLGFPISPILNLFGDRYSKLSYFTNNDVLSFYLGVRGLFTPQEAAKILDINESEVRDFIINMETSDVPNIGANYRTSDVRKLDEVNLLSYLELKLYLQNQLLKDTDFMSMHHSVEVRVPFLDHKLVEYIASLPPKLKLNNSITNNLITKVNKPLLVAAVRDLLPQEIFTRPKMGFTFPFQKWLGEVDSYSVNKLLRLKSNNPIINNSITKTHWSRFWAKTVLSKFL